MTSERGQRLGLRAGAALVFVTVVLALSLGVLIWTDVTGVAEGSLGETISLAIAFLSFFGVGMAIVLRRPRHPIGWLFVALGVYPMAQESVARLGEMAMEKGGGETLFLVSHIVFSWPAFLGTLVVFIPLLFPTGRLPSPRWRWLAWLAGATIGVMVVGAIFQRDVCVTYDAIDNCIRRIENPIGFTWLENVEESSVGAAMLGVLVVCLLGAWTSVVVRYRRSQGVERAQLRWFTFAIGLFLSYTLVVGVFVEEFLELGPELEGLVPFGIDPFGLFLSFVPLSVGVAILRYRLYDIDRIISRTVGYGLVTAVLVAAYAGAVFLLRRLLPAQSQLAVAGSTLAVAALFNPVRRRIQTLVDRRFNRSRYDGASVVDDFGVRLRSEIGLDDLSGDLLRVAGTTMQPRTASLWLRDRGA